MFFLFLNMFIPWLGPCLVFRCCFNSTFIRSFIWPERKSLFNSFFIYQLQQQVQGENGIDVVDESGEPQAAGGVAGFAKGLLQKGLTVKDNLKEKASSLNTQNLQGIGTNLMGGISSFMPGRKEEEVPTPPEDNPNTEEVMLEGDMQYLQQEWRTPNRVKSQSQKKQKWTQSCIN